MKSTYTEDNFEDYFRDTVERYCRDNGIAFRLSDWDDARENLRDDCMEIDDDGHSTEEPAYEDQDLIDEYLYFCLTSDLDDFMETTVFHGRHLAPEHDDQAMTYDVWVYRAGDKPFSHYDTGRMDLYRGSYSFDKASCLFTFQDPLPVTFDI